MAQDFPEKVYLAKIDSALCTGWIFEGEIGSYDEVQPYFSASLVEELVEALEDRHKPDCAVFEEMYCDCTCGLTELLSKAQSSLGVKE